MLTLDDVPGDSMRSDNLSGEHVKVDKHEACVAAALQTKQVLFALPCLAFSSPTEPVYLPDCLAASCVPLVGYVIKSMASFVVTMLLNHHFHHFTVLLFTLCAQPPSGSLR